MYMLRGLLKLTSASFIARFVATPYHDLSLRTFLSFCAQEHALRRLYDLVDTHWAEAADSVAAIEALADAGSQLAAAVASKVYYHLEAYPEAVRLALAAGPLFDVDGRSEYVETIVGT